jgi:hypothetical protein
MSLDDYLLYEDEGDEEVQGRGGVNPAHMIYLP